MPSARIGRHVANARGTNEAVGQAPVLLGDGIRYLALVNGGQRLERRNTTMASKQADELRTLYRGWAGALSDASWGMPRTRPTAPGT